MPDGMETECDTFIAIVPPRLLTPEGMDGMVTLDSSPRAKISVFADYFNTDWRLRKLVICLFSFKKKTKKTQTVDTRRDIRYNIKLDNYENIGYITWRCQLYHHHHHPMLALTLQTRLSCFFYDQKCSVGEILITMGGLYANHTIKGVSW